MKHFKTMERLSEASEEELTAVGDIGKVSADWHPKLFFG